MAGIHEHESSRHDVDGEDAALMPCEQIIDENADDGVRLVSRFRDDATCEYAGATVPFQIDCTVCLFAVNFRPAMRTARTHVLGRNQSETLELGIAHDFVP